MLIEHGKQSRLACQFVTLIKYPAPQFAENLQKVCGNSKAWKVCMYLLLKGGSPLYSGQINVYVILRLYSLIDCCQR